MSKLEKNKQQSNEVSGWMGIIIYMHNGNNNNNSISSSIF